MNTLIVGWNEIGALPELGISALPIKIDTGAKTSSLHATNITIFEKDNQPWVRFDTINSNCKIITIEAKVFDQREVKSSNGETQTRFVITTNLTLDEHTWKIQLTLADRSKMRFKMLLGRRAMENIHVSPMQQNLLS